MQVIMVLNVLAIALLDLVQECHHFVLVIHGLLEVKRQFVDECHDEAGECILPPQMLFKLEYVKVEVFDYVKYMAFLFEHCCHCVETMLLLR